MYWLQVLGQVLGTCNVESTGKKSQVIYRSSTWKLLVKYLSKNLSDRDTSGSTSHILIENFFSVPKVENFLLARHSQIMLTRLSRRYQPHPLIKLIFRDRVISIDVARKIAIGQKKWTGDKMCKVLGKSAVWYADDIRWVREDVLGSAGELLAQ